MGREKKLRKEKRKSRTRTRTRTRRTRKRVKVIIMKTKKRVVGKKRRRRTLKIRKIHQNLSSSSRKSTQRCAIWQPRERRFWNPLRKLRKMQLLLIQKMKMNLISNKTEFIGVYTKLTIFNQQYILPCNEELVVHLVTSIKVLAAMYQCTAQNLQSQLW